MAVSIYLLNEAPQMETELKLKLPWKEKNKKKQLESMFLFWKKTKPNQTNHHMNFCVSCSVILLCVSSHIESKLS